MERTVIMNVSLRNMKMLELARSNYENYNAWLGDAGEGAQRVYIDLDTNGQKLRFVSIATYDTYRLMP